MEEGMTEKEAEFVRKSTLYDLRLFFSKAEKEEYTKREILELLDMIAVSKDGLN